MPAIKRQLSGSARCSKVARKANDAEAELRQHFEPIAAAMRGMPDVPAGAIEMLIMALPSCLQTVPEQRHEFQREMLTMGTEACLAIESHLKGVVSAGQAKLEQAPAEKERRIAETMAAKKTLEVASVLVAQRETVLGECKQAEAATKAVVEDAATKRKELDSKVAAIQRSKSALDSVVSTQLASLKLSKGGKWEVKAVMKELKSIEPFEETLLQAATQALTKVPEKRVAFDCLALTHLENAIAASMDKYDSDLTALHGDLDNMDAANVPAQTSFNEAESALQAAVLAKNEATLSLDAANAALSAAQQVEADYDADMERDKAEFQQAQAKLEDFEKVTLPAFQRLRDNGPVSAMDTGDTATVASADLAESDKCQDIVAATAPAEPSQSDQCQDITATAALVEPAQSEPVAPTEPVQPDSFQDVKASPVDLVPASSPAARAAAGA